MKLISFRIIPFILIFLFINACHSPKNVPFSSDVIVYGGTSAAVTAAVEVAQSGKTVILVSPDTHLGGLTSNGLGFTDTGNKEAIGGLAREFYHRVYMHYNDSSAWKWQKHAEWVNGFRYVIKGLKFSFCTYCSA